MSMPAFLPNLRNTKQTVLVGHGSSTLAAKGTHRFKPDPRAKMLWMYISGPGGGGAAGQINNTNTGRPGGGAGGAGAAAMLLGPSFFCPELVLLLGLAGVGGTTSGGNGTVGQDTIVYAYNTYSTTPITLLTVFGGQAGNGSGSGGAATSTPSDTIWTSRFWSKFYTGAAGGAGSASVAGTSNTGVAIANSINCSGGGGGGTNSTNVGLAAGSSYACWQDLLYVATAGIVGGEVDGQNSPGAPWTTINGLMGLGGGAGGAGGGTTRVGNGAAASPGCGGGGGGGGLTGQAVGKGGEGGPSYAIFIEW